MCGQKKKRKKESVVLGGNCRGHRKKQILLTVERSVITLIKEDANTWAGAPTPPLLNPNDSAIGATLSHPTPVPV